MDKNKRNRGGRAPTRHRRNTEPRFAFRLLPWLIRSVCLLPAGAAFASPQGGAVIAGQGTIGQPDGSTTVIRQQSNSLAIDWRSFDLAAGDRVRFEQPSSSAAVLNRVLSQRPSQILGSIQANGRVFLINPAGIIFGAGARVNVGSLVASSLGMSTSDFMAGNYRFQSAAGQDGGLVVNRGVIQAATGGSVSLIGGAVANQGAIVADYGYVNLGAGRQAVLDFGGDGLMGFQVSGKVLTNATGVKSAVSNSGTITAGEVVLSGQAAADVFTQAVNNQGVVRAGRIDDSGGTIRLAAAGAGAVNTGTLDASATAAGQHGGSVVMVGPEVSQDGVVRADAASGDGGTVTVQAADQAVLGGDSVTSARSVSGGTGGTVQVLGDKVGLLDQASIDVSGAQGGGTALVGGNARGQGPLPNAGYAFMSSGASIDANATSTGHGGHVVLWSNYATRAYGRIAARGGDAGGDGGLIETSGHYLDVSGLRVNAGAPQGMAGNWLLDPYNVEIVPSGGTAATKVTGTTATWTASTSPTQINASDIVTELQAGTNVTIQTDGATPAGTDAGTITVGAAITPTMSTSAATLSLDAASDITIQTGAAITASGANPLNVTLSSAGGAITTSSAITTNNGALTMNGGGAVTISANLDAGTGTVGIDSGGSGSIAGTGTITAANVNLQTVSGTGAVGSSSAALKLSAGSGTATTVAVGNGGNAASAAYLDQTSGNLVLGTSNVGGVLKAISDAGAITQSGALTVGGLTTLTANDATNGSIDVSTQANAFGGAVSLNAAHDGKVTNAGNLLLGASNVGGALTATSNTGTVTQNGVLTVGATTALTANDATNGSVDVSTQSNAFGGAVSVNTAGAGKVTNAGNLLLGTSNVTGALSATSNTGTVTQNGVLTVGGTTSLTANDATNGSVDVSTQSNAFTGAVSMNTAHDGKVTNVGNLVLGASNVGGALTAKSNTGTITQNGVLTVGGTTNLTANDATNGAIDVSTQSNGFSGAVSLNTAGAGKVTNSAALVLGASTVGGGLTVGNHGSITVSGPVAAGAGTVSLDTGGSGAITGSGTITAGTVNLQTVSGTGAVGASGGALQLAASTGTGTTTVNVGTATNLVNGVYLNQATGNLDVSSLNLVSGAGLSLTSAGTLTLPAMNINTGSNDLTLSSGVGSLSTVGTLSTTGTLTLSATGGNLVIGHALSSGAMDLTAGGTIGETVGGTVSTTTGALTTSSAGGTTLTGANTVAAFNGTNTGSGDIALTNTAATLDVTGVSQSGGALSVNNTGALQISGAVDTGSAAATLTASGAISQGTAGKVTTGTLTTSSAGGTTLNGTTNAVSAFNGTNSGTGGIALKNTAATLDVTGVSQSGGALSVNNTGALRLTGGVNAGSSGATLTATGAITQSAGTITAGTLTTSSAGGTTLGGANAVVAFNGTNTGSGDISLTNTQALNLTGASQSGGGAVRVANSGAITVLGAVNAGTGAVSLDSGGAGAITGSGTITAGTVNLQTSGGTGAVGGLGNPLQLASSSGSGSTAVNVGQSATPVAGIYLKQTSGNLLLGSLYAGSAAVSISSSGNIDGDGVATHRVHTTGALTLTSTGAGIGAATAVNTALGGAGTLDLSSGGTGSAGAIAVSDDGTMTTGRIGSVKFTGAGAHSLSLGAVSWTVDNHLGSSGNDLSLTASNGGIVGAGAGFLIANNLDLAATGGSIGTPLNTLVGGTLTAQSDTGSIYITNAGALTIGKITAAGAVTLNAGANAITEGTNGLITAGTVNLQTASGSSGAVGSSTAALKLSAGSGTATTVNVGASSTPVNALYLDQTSGNLVLGNTYVGGALAVNTSGALLLGGAVSSQGGALSLTAGTSITQPGTLDSHGGNIAVTADGGGIDLSSGGIAKSEGGNITYKSTGGDINLGLLDAGTGMVTVDAAGGSILNVNGSTTAANVRAASAALTASQFIGSAASSIVFDIPSTGTIRLQLGAPVAYISNPNRTPVTSTSVVADIASEVANSGARSQAAGLQTVGYVDWSAFSPNLSLFGVNEPGVKLPAGQQDQ